MTIQDKKKNKKFNIAFIGYITEEKGLKYLEELTEKVKGTDITSIFSDKQQTKNAIRIRKIMFITASIYNKIFPTYC